MQLKIMFLVLTDALCWLPICVTCMISFAGVKIPDTMYFASACILLPINSAINPLIYSKFGMGLIQKLRQHILPSKKTNMSANNVVM